MGESPLLKIKQKNGHILENVRSKTRHKTARKSVILSKTKSKNNRNRGRRNQLKGPEKYFQQNNRRARQWWYTLLASYQAHRLKLDSKTTESLNSWKLNNSLISENEVTQTQEEKFTFMWILAIKQMIAKLQSVDPETLGNTQIYLGR